MRRREREGPGPVRWTSRRVPAAAVLVFALLVFTWPFVRTPALTLGESYLHLLGAWLGVVVLLFAISRYDETDDEETGPDA